MLLVQGGIKMYFSLFFVIIPAVSSPLSFTFSCGLVVVILGDL